MRILIIDKCHPVLKQKFESVGCICEYSEANSKEKVQQIISQYDGMIIRSRFIIDKDFLNCATKLKFIGRAGAGLENIDIEYANILGIKCFNSPEGNRDAVGEHAIGMLLSLFNNLYKSNFEVKSGIWKREENRGIEMKGKTISIIGYGNTGGAFAKKLSGFEMDVISYDKYRYDYSDSYVKESGLEEIFEKSDIVSLHVPLSPETKYMVDEKFLRNFRKNIFIINTSRGQVIDTEALVNNLKSGKISGAALDVLEYENYTFENLVVNNKNESFNYLLNSDKVLLSPHIAGWTSESFYKMSSILADKIINEVLNH
jgi:D-3-phosphoglycerate dehydrogenase / 2-oxoglutarate reductase